MHTHRAIPHSPPSVSPWATLFGAHSRSIPRTKPHSYSSTCKAQVTNAFQLSSSLPTIPRSQIACASAKQPPHGPRCCHRRRQNALLPTLHRLLVAAVRHSVHCPPTVAATPQFLGPSQTPSTARHCPATPTPHCPARSSHRVYNVLFSTTAPTCFPI